MLISDDLLIVLFYLLLILSMLFSELLYDFGVLLAACSLLFLFLLFLIRISVWRGLRVIALIFDLLLKGLIFLTE